jgi:glycosyltransferase involved in cell wall biosynthesis
MRILQIIHSIDPAGGGVAEGANQLGATMTSMGHQVEIASLDQSNAPFLASSPLVVHALGAASNGYGYSKKFVPWLLENHNTYDAIVVNGLWQFHSFGTWQALCKSNTPYVVYPHGMLDPWFKKEYPLKHLKKWLYWPWAEYRVLRDAAAVLFTCQEEKLMARKSFWLYRCNEVVVSLGTSSPDGDSEREMREFFSRYPALKDKKLALFMGRIHPKKGCDLLIDAFAKLFRQHPDWHLVMAGPDQVGWRAELIQQAEALGIASRITWTGMLSGELKWGALRSAEVFVLPSHQENFGIAVAEALAIGVPTLISDKVNIWREVLADGAGLVAEDTREGTRRLLQSYLDMPEEKKLAMRESARNSFWRRFEIRRAAENLESILLRITQPNEKTREKHHELLQTQS